MRIVTWNCNMAFRKKAQMVLRYQPDLLVIPECEHPSILKLHKDLPPPRQSLWFGSNQNKGLGIFSYSDLRLKLHPKYNPAFKLIVPVVVSNKDLKFSLYAIWANNPGDRDGQYVTQVWKAVHFYDRILKGKSTLLVGDFNSNTIWDRPRRKGNHSHVVSHLQKKGIHSVYHHHFGEEQGKEAHQTFYLYRQEKRSYHIDYCFASNDLLDKLESFEIGDFNTWSTFSDHVPVIVNFDMDRQPSAIL
jgi:exonuclease III